MKNYTSVDYARNRLIGTVVRVAGQAAFIDDIGKDRVSYTDFITGSSFRKPLEELDINPVPLGYCNTFSTAAYLMRYSVRKDWKQGLRYQTLHCLCEERITSEMIPWNDVFKTINGIFPKFEEVVNILEKNKQIKMMAYSRNFAIKNTMEIVYKGQYTIGKVVDINAHDGVSQIDEKFEWVREEFEASVIW